MEHELGPGEARRVDNGHLVVGPGGICFCFCPNSLCFISPHSAYNAWIVPIMPNYAAIFRLALPGGVDRPVHHLPHGGLRLHPWQDLP
jgi:hypothetical protein